MLISLIPGFAAHRRGIFDDYRKRNVHTQWPTTVINDISTHCLHGNRMSRISVESYGKKPKCTNGFGIYRILQDDKNYFFPNVHYYEFRYFPAILFQRNTNFTLFFNITRRLIPFFACILNTRIDRYKTFAVTKMVRINFKLWYFGRKI